MSKQENPPKKLTFIENFCLSGLAAIISKTVAAPIERIKLLVQNQGEMIKYGNLDSPYKGIVDCTIKIYQKEGFLSFWKGNLANCIRYFTTQSLNFAFKDKIKQLVNIKKTENQKVIFTKNIMSGGFAGSLSLIIVYPLDYLRTRLANDLKSSKKGGSRQYSGIIDVYKQTIGTDGIQGFYRGFVISCYGVFIYRGLYFGLYDSLRPILLSDNSPFILSFALGYSVTVVAGLLFYPIDTIRRRMMMTSGEDSKYKGSMDCLLKILKNEGFRPLMHGAGANILRGIAGAGVLAGFDKIVQFYTKGAKIDTSD